MTMRALPQVIWSDPNPTANQSHRPIEWPDGRERGFMASELARRRSARLASPRAAALAAAAAGNDAGQEARGRDHGRADHEHRREHRRRPRRRSRASSRRARTRTRSSRSRASAELLSRADVVFVNGLELEEPTVELAEANSRTARRSSSSATQCIAEKDWIYDFSFPKADGKPNPHLWTDPTYARCYAQVVRDDARRSATRQRRLLRGELRERSRRWSTQLDGAMRDVVRHDPEAQAADLPRRVRLLRDGLRLEGHRRDPGLRLRGPDAAGGRRPDRPGRGREGAGDLRLRGVPEPGARADRRARRASATSTCCATTTCPASRATPSTRGSG